MSAGIILIVTGSLLVVYPPLLSIIVAGLLIFAGTMPVSIARFERGQQRRFTHPTIGFIFRHESGECGLHKTRAG